MKHDLHIDRLATRLRGALQACAPALVGFAATITGLGLASPSLAKGYCYKAESLKGPYGEPGTEPIAPVCRALERNLNEFCDQPPMVCDLKIHPRHRGDFALPTWKPVDLGGSLKLLEELIRAPWLSAHDPNAATTIWESERPDIEIAFNAGRLRVSSAWLDMYQTGLQAKVYQYDMGDCAQKNSHLTSSNVDGAWDKELTSPRTPVVLSADDVRILQKQYRPLNSSLGGLIFLYRGQPYMYHMYGYHRRGTDPSLPPTNEVTVSQGENFWLTNKPTIGSSDVCEINYQSGRTK